MFDDRPGAQTAHVPPQNLEAERSVLGAMMVSAASIEPVFGDVRLATDDFYRERHRVVYEAIKVLFERNEAVDALTVTEYLTQNGRLEEAGGHAEVQSLPDQVPAPGNARHYASIVKQNALLRRLLVVGQEIQRSVHAHDGEPQELAENAERLIFEVAQQRFVGRTRYIGAILEEEVDRIEAASKHGELRGEPTGFREFDEMTSGLRSGELVVIGARPGMGKTAWCTQVAEHLSVNLERPTLFFSLEMSEGEDAERLLASRSGLPGSVLHRGRVETRDWPRIIRAANRLSPAPLAINDSVLNLAEIRLEARRQHMKEFKRGGLSLILVDYLQLVTPLDPKQSRVEQVGAISRGLKALAKELQVPVLAVSQLNRGVENRPVKRPTLADLRESGQVEQDASVVGFLYRDDYYNPDSDTAGTAELIVAKNRHGPTGTLELGWVKEGPRFEDRALGPMHVTSPSLVETEDGG